MVSSKGEVSVIWLEVWTVDSAVRLRCTHEYHRFTVSFIRYSPPFWQDFSCLIPLPFTILALVSIWLSFDKKACGRLVYFHLSRKFPLIRSSNPSCGSFQRSTAPCSTISKDCLDEEKGASSCYLLLYSLLHNSSTPLGLNLLQST